MKKLVFALALALFFACKTGPEKCTAGKPVAIFSKDLPHVRQHLFEQTGHESLESLELDTGVLLEIEQSGCEELRQEFRFTAPGNRQAVADSIWAKEAVRQLVFLSSLGKKQAAFRLWADAIEAARPSIKLGENYSLEPGVAVKVDKIASPEQSILLLTLFQRQEKSN